MWGTLHFIDSQLMSGIDKLKGKHVMSWYMKHGVQNLFYSQCWSWTVPLKYNLILGFLSGCKHQERNYRTFHFIQILLSLLTWVYTWSWLCFTLIFIVTPCILITLMFLSPTNAPLYYTYKILKYTVKISHDCSYMFRSTWTIIREPMPNLAKVTILWR